jgi:hypothetical protein
LRLPIQRIFDFDQIAHFIGEGGHVAQGIGDRERLGTRMINDNSSVGLLFQAGQFSF